MTEIDETNTPATKRRDAYPISVIDENRLLDQIEAVRRAALVVRKERDQTNSTRMGVTSGLQHWSTYQVIYPRIYNRSLIKSDLENLNVQLLERKLIAKQIELPTSFLKNEKKVAQLPTNQETFDSEVRELQRQLDTFSAADEQTPLSQNILGADVQEDARVAGQPAQDFEQLKKMAADLLLREYQLSQREAAVAAQEAAIEEIQKILEHSKKDLQAYHRRLEQAKQKLEASQTSLSHSQDKLKLQTTPVDLRETSALHSTPNHPPEAYESRRTRKRRADESDFPMEY